MIIYISGPITGMPDNNHPAFNEAAASLRAMGHEVCNPAEFQAPCENPTHADWMQLSLEKLSKCEAVAMLPGWTLSKGAGIEFVYAARCGKRAMPLARWLEGK